MTDLSDSRPNNKHLRFNFRKRLQRYKTAITLVLIGLAAYLITIGFGFLVFWKR